jgi:hypothetical protein
MAAAVSVGLSILRALAFARPAAAYLRCWRAWMSGMPAASPLKIMRWPRKRLGLWLVRRLRDLRQMAARQPMMVV